LLTGILPLCCAIALLSACSSDSTPGPAGTGGSSAGAGGTGGSNAGTGDPNAVIGNFDITLNAPVPASGDTPANPGYTLINGIVATTASPPSRTLVEKETVGDCVLLIPSVPFCNPTCGSEAACVAINTKSNAGACVAFPRARDAGKVTFTGLMTEPGSAPTVIPPDQSKNYVPNADIKLSYPPFQEGAVVTMTAAGAEVPTFTVMTKGIRPLELIANGPIKIEPNQPMPLRWTAAGPAGSSRIEVLLEISHHGGFKGIVTCDTADTGSLDVPAKLITGLIGLGVAGFPTVSLTRKTVGYAQLADGRVALNAVSTRANDIVVAGFISCDDDKAPCPTGKTCGDDHLCH
jgi:hypothetical protein